MYVVYPFHHYICIPVLGMKIGVIKIKALHAIVDHGVNMSLIYTSFQNKPSQFCLTSIKLFIFMGHDETKTSYSNIGTF